MRWRHVSTGERGWSRQVLEVRGYVVGSVDSFDYGHYGTTVDGRTGCMADRRRCKRVVRRRAERSTSGLMKFIRDQTR